MVSRKGHSASHLAFIDLVVVGCRVTASRYIEHAVKSTQSGGARSPEVNTEIRKDSSHNLFADTFDKISTLWQQPEIRTEPRKLFFRGPTSDKGDPAVSAEKRHNTAWIIHRHLGPA